MHSKHTFFKVLDSQNDIVTKVRLISWPCPWFSGCFLGQRV